MSELEAAGEIRDIRHYTGGGRCHYECGEPAEYVVVATRGTRTVTFGGCRECLKQNHIHPVVNGWVDERSPDEEVRHR